MTRPKIIIDADPGTDDAGALFILSAAHEQGLVEVIAMTVSHGNGSLEDCVQNALRILQVAGLKQIPVYAGCTESLATVFHPMQPSYHGTDAFGDVMEKEPVVGLDQLQEEHAASALVRLINKHPGEIILIGFAPLTNMAVALNLDPHCFEKLKDLYIMGGNLTGALVSPSSWTEFNFFVDPEAAKVVLERSGKEIKLVPWETCCKHSKFSMDERDEFGKCSSPKAQLLNAIEGNILRRVREKIQPGLNGWYACDQLVTSWVMDEIFKENFAKERMVQATTRAYGTVELQGTTTRGTLTYDPDGIWGKPHNLQILQAVDRDVYKKYLKISFGIDSHF